MQSLFNKAEALLDSVDTLIAKYGDDRPDLVRDLEGHRRLLQAAIAQRKAQDVVLNALRLSSLIRYVVDFFDSQ
jgi:hypothetical protein